MTDGILDSIDGPNHSDRRQPDLQTPPAFIWPFAVSAPPMVRWCQHAAAAQLLAAQGR